MGGRFYKFLYEVEEILVRNPVKEDDSVRVRNDQKESLLSTPKRKRQDGGIEPSKSVHAPVEHGTSSFGGKACRLLPLEKENENEEDNLSDSYESDDDKTLFIEKLANENSAQEGYEEKSDGGKIADHEEKTPDKSTDVQTL